MSADAASRDAADPLRAFRERFVPMPAGRIYLAGHSLGRSPRGADTAVGAQLDRWADAGVRGWSDGWLALGRDLARMLEEVIGAAAGTVAVGDSTSVNLYKVAMAALAAVPGRSDILSDTGNFPTDLYILEAVARTHGGALRLLDPGPRPDDVAAALDPGVGLLALSHVDFRSGALLALPEITAAAHAAGAPVAWDLSHSAGVVPVEITRAGADYAVGCTYKYLHGGPGAPAFLYVRPDLLESVGTPIPGWMGHADPFLMETAYRPAPGVARFMAGTPPVLGLAAALVGIGLVAEAGIDAVRAKALELSAYAMALTDTWVATHGVEVVTPRGEDRAGQVALRHPDAWQIVQSLLADFDVVCDFREPDIVRFGLSPLPLSFADVEGACARMRECLETARHHAYPVARMHVT